MVVVVVVVVDEVSIGLFDLLLSFSLLSYLFK